MDLHAPCYPAEQASDSPISDPNALANLSKKPVEATFTDPKPYSMKAPNAFQTRLLTGRPPSEADATVYGAVYGRLGTRELQRNLQDQTRYTVAPWTLQANGRDVGVGGFHIGLGAGTEGIELMLALSPDVTQVGLAGEFLRDAILFAIGTLRADRIFAFTDAETTLTVRMLAEAGFEDGGPMPVPGRPDRRVMLWTAANAPRA
jgi:hypothetical protein